MVPEKNTQSAATYRPNAVKSRSAIVRANARSAVKTSSRSASVERCALLDAAVSDHTSHARHASQRGGTLLHPAHEPAARICPHLRLARRRPDERSFEHEDDETEHVDRMHF